MICCQLIRMFCPFCIGICSRYNFRQFRIGLRRIICLFILACLCQLLCQSCNIYRIGFQILHCCVNLGNFCFYICFHYLCTLVYRSSCFQYCLQCVCAVLGIQAAVNPIERLCNFAKQWRLVSPCVLIRRWDVEIGRVSRDACKIVRDKGLSGGFAA